MTINQAKGLKIGQTVSHIFLGVEGTVTARSLFGVRITWNGFNSHWYLLNKLNSIHILAN